MNVMQKTSALVLITLLGVSACSQKPSSEEIAAQVKIALEQERAQVAAQNAASAPVVAPAAAPAPVVVEPAPAPAPAPVVHKTAPTPKPKPVVHTAPAKAEPVAVLKPICSNCGEVVAVNVVEVAGKGSGLGGVAGAVVGGLVGNQVGDGRGKDVATVVGVVGGAFAGNAIEKNAKKTKRYDIVVRMEDGSERTLSQVTDPMLVNGQKVKIENDVVVKN
ncbi:MAG: glycine zipper 2TM domain-containing protein [Gallionella sp.]